jgi:hypothetical protein
MDAQTRIMAVHLRQAGSAVDCPYEALRTATEGMDLSVRNNNKPLLPKTFPKKDGAIDFEAMSSSDESGVFVGLVNLWFCVKGSGSWGVCLIRGWGGGSAGRFRKKVPPLEVPASRNLEGRFRRKVPQEGSAFGSFRQWEIPKGGFARRFREENKVVGPDEVVDLEAHKDDPNKKVDVPNTKDEVVDLDAHKDDPNKKVDVPNTKILKTQISVCSSDNDPASAAPRIADPQSCGAEDSPLSSSEEVPHQPAKSGEAKNKALLNAALQKSKDKKESKSKGAQPGSKISPWGSPPPPLCIHVRFPLGVSPRWAHPLGFTSLGSQPLGPSPPRGSPPCVYALGVHLPGFTLSPLGITPLGLTSIGVHVPGFTTLGGSPWDSHPSPMCAQPLGVHRFPHGIPPFGSPP